jgi:hypothetical protein
MDVKQDRILELLNKSEDELYAEVGNDITNSLMDKPLEYYIQLAKEWFAAKIPVWRGSLCQNQDVKILLSKKNTVQDKVNLISAIADFIASLKTGVAPFTVAVLIFKYGVSKICEEELLG